MRLHDKINLLIDLLLTLALALIAGIGFLIKYILPPGRERILKYGDNTELAFLGLDRHQWGGIHLLVAYVMLGLLILHIVLHWKTILCLVRKAIPMAWLRRSLWTATGVLCFFLLLFAFFISPTRLQTGDFLHRNARSKIEHSPVGKNTRVGEDQPIEAARGLRGKGYGTAGQNTDGGSDRGESLGSAAADGGGHHRHGVGDHDSLNGRMTLDEVARRFGISIDEVRRRLELPAYAGGSETLGRLRKTYGFTMEEARERLGKAR